MNRDNTLRHLAHLPRRFGNGLQVGSLCFIYAKRNWVDFPLSNYAFSFILAGSGSYRIAGRDQRIAAPCVITQWPDAPMYYGPDKQWYECYITYAPAMAGQLRERGYFDPARPYWQLQHADLLLQHARQLHDQLFALGPEQIDALCEALLVDSLCSEQPGPATQQQMALRQLQTRIERDPVQPLRLQREVRELGLSEATFRRRWQELGLPPPQQYRLHLLMREAARLLVESEQAIKGIAADLGFDDQLYFGRRFRQHYGLSPRAYRRAHRLPQ